MPIMRALGQRSGGRITKMVPARAVGPFFSFVRYTFSPATLFLVDLQRIVRLHGSPFTFFSVALSTDSLCEVCDTHTNSPVKPLPKSTAQRVHMHFSGNYPS